MRMRVSLLAAVLVASVSVAPALADPSKPVTRNGYIRMHDGVLLRYSLILPASRGRFPVVLRYGPYDSGEKPFSLVPFLRDFINQGVAVIGVNVRGTTCSGGAIKLLDPDVGRDGAAAVEWIARQPWSTGRVAMAGYSFEGINQLFVAEQRPPHLVAIAPGQVVSDLYRDVAFPGGLLNRGYVVNYPPEQVFISDKTMAEEIAAGDTVCAMNATQRDPKPLVKLVGQALTSSYLDEGTFPWRGLAPDTQLGRINVPVLLTRTWQDNQTGPRMSYLPTTFGTKNVWTIAGNGPHMGFYDSTPFVTTALERFLIFYLTGAKNHWPVTPPVQVLHELNAKGRPAWVTGSATWTPPTRPLDLYLSDGGRLSRSRSRATSASTSYVYPTLSPSAPDGDQFEVYGMSIHAKDPVPGTGWRTPVTPHGYVAFTTPALMRDVEILGSGNAELWLRSTASDTDLQITLTEVRPDGQEIYLQRGWLRASHRAEDPKRSTALRPLQTHRLADMHALVPGTPTHMRVELFPVDHVFRKGSSIRLIIDAPTGLTGDWELNFLNTPAVNTIVHDAKHPSRFVLPLVDGEAHAPMPACGTVVGEPCRRSIAPVPSGTLQP